MAGQLRRPPTDVEFERFNQMLLGSGAEEPVVLPEQPPLAAVARDAQLQREAEPISFDVEQPPGADIQGIDPLQGLNQGMGQGLGGEETEGEIPASLMRAAMRALKGL